MGWRNNQTSAWRCWIDRNVMSSYALHIVFVINAVSFTSKCKFMHEAEEKGPLCSGEVRFSVMHEFPSQRCMSFLTWLSGKHFNVFISAVFKLELLRPGRKEMIAQAGNEPPHSRACSATFSLLRQRGSIMLFGRVSRGRSQLTDCLQPDHVISSLLLFLCAADWCPGCAWQSELVPVQLLEMITRHSLIAPPRLSGCLTVGADAQGPGDQVGSIKWLHGDAKQPQRAKQSVSFVVVCLSLGVSLLARTVQGS